MPEQQPSWRRDNVDLAAHCATLLTVGSRTSLDWLPCPAPDLDVGIQGSRVLGRQAVSDPALKVPVRIGGSVPGETSPTSRILPDRLCIPSTNSAPVPRSYGSSVTRKESVRQPCHLRRTASSTPRFGDSRTSWRRTEQARDSSSPRLELRPAELALFHVKQAVRRRRMLLPNQLLTQGSELCRETVETG